MLTDSFIGTIECRGLTIFIEGSNIPTPACSGGNQEKGPVTASFTNAGGSLVHVCTFSASPALVVDLGPGRLVGNVRSATDALLILQVASSFVPDQGHKKNGNVGPPNNELQRTRPAQSTEPRR
jgi:hypothetical protein